MENQMKASESLPSDLQTSRKRPSPIAHSTSGGGRAGSIRSMRALYPAAAAASAETAVEGSKIEGVAATDGVVMEDPTPPAESDGPPSAAGRGVPSVPGANDWADAVQRHGRWLR